MNETTNSAPNDGKKKRGPSHRISAVDLARLTDPASDLYAALIAQSRQPDRRTPVAVVLEHKPQGETGRQTVLVGQQLAGDERWLVVLAFVVANGATDLVAHLVVPTPPGWFKVLARPSATDPMRDGRSIASMWLHQLGGAMRLDATPQERLTNSLVRSASTAPLERWARGFIADRADRFPSGGRGDARPRGPVRGRRESRLVKVAAAYVALTHRPDISDPVATLAVELGLARNTVSSYLFQCRHEYGLLTPSTRGVAGGALTPKGEALVAAITNDKEATS